MTTNFPLSLDSFTTKIDNLTDVMAADVNNLQDSVLAIENLLGAPPLGYFRVAPAGTYVSATSLTIPGDVTALFKLGTKVRLINSTTKYGYVLSSSYSSPNTTIYLVPNTSSSLANAAITNIDVSYGNPPDFPAAFTYAPTVYPTTGAFTTISASGEFSLTDRLCYLKVTITITTNGTASGLFCTVPINNVNTTILVGRENQATGAMLQGYLTSNAIGILTYANGNVNGDGRTIHMSGAYRI